MLDDTFFLTVSLMVVVSSQLDMSSSIDYTFIYVSSEFSHPENVNA
jgi:hypothetical protein